MEIVGRDPGVRGFAVQPRRWVVGRTFAWLVRNRRLRIDDERKVQTSETLIEVAMIHLLLRRLARHAETFTKHALSSTFPIRMEGPIWFSLARSAVPNSAETFRLSSPDTDMRKVEPGECSALRRRGETFWAHRSRSATANSGPYAADQMGKVELRPLPQIQVVR